MNAPAWENLEPGDELPPLAVDLESGFVRDHAIAMGMEADRFTDEAKAREEGLPGQITPGNMSLGLLTRTLLTWLPGARIERIGTTFRGLARAGQPVRIQAMITEKDIPTGRIECDIWMESETGDRLVIGTAALRFGARETA